MRILLALLAAAVLAFAGIGWYLGWYQIKSDPAASGHQNVNIDFNEAKILADVKKTRKVVEDMKKSADEATAPDSAATQPPVSPPAPAAIAPKP